MPKAVISRARRSKPEVEKEFSKVVDEAAEQKENTDSKTQELARLRQVEIQQAVEGISVEGVVQSLSNLGLETSKALAEISGKLVFEVERLTSIREAVALQTKELERLHKIDIAATAIDHLVLDYQSQKHTLEAEISTQREAWSAEELQRAREQKEYEENLKKQRQREVEDYEYKKPLERKKAQDKYEEETRVLEKKNKEKQEDIEKSWKQRETSLREKEEEGARLRKEVDEFPVRLKMEVDGAVSNAAKSAEQRFEQERILLKQERAPDRRLADLQTRTLSGQLAAPSTEIEKQRAQV